MRSFFLIFCGLICLLTTKTYASHAAGGEIYYECTGPNTYNVYVRLFRDCNPGNLSYPTSVTVGVYDQSTHNTYTNLTLNPITTSTDLDLGDDCYTPTGLCIDERVYGITGITIADNANGYYMETHINTRNNLADNLMNPSSFTLIFFAILEDPAIGQNSSPNFGNYPLDSYMCTTGPTIWNFPVTDADGDSLAYSFVEPLGNSDPTGTTSGSGAYPYYGNVPWSLGYSLANLYNGTTPMTIDPVTGEVFAYPDNLGTYAFVVRVEEFRNGVKIGEVRRDVQYAALSCTQDIPPSIDMPDTVAVYAGDQFCVDVTVRDADGTDTLYVIPTSPDFDLVNTFEMPTASGADWIYPDFNGTGANGVMDHFDIVNGEYEGVGEMLLRYCWQPGCESIDNLYHINLFAYSFGCSGSDTTEKEVVFNIQYEPAQVTVDLPDSINVTYDEEICFEILTVDNLYSGYDLSLTPQNGNFDYNEAYQAPISSGGEHYYLNFNGIDTVRIRDYSFNSSNGMVTGKDTVAIRYCWTPGCGDVILENYQLTYDATLYTECYDITETKSTEVSITPPTGELQITPNVFTPNNDGVNDVYKLGGTPDPCYDNITITIFNRWGKKVFESDDPYFEWDGTNKNKGNECADGTYFVIISGTYGSDYDAASGERKPLPVEFKQTIQLMR